ncbi:MAG: DUF4388 domain-containing protein [Thermoanaerobaculum sp.]|nr:DUF4388 domain-containing protein [Thermoanaerobaculum sp.]
MALEGTLRDFSLADIFQLIGLQRKTGVLTLRSQEDVVTISFLDGKIVGADSLNKRLEDRLGQVLLKSKAISREALERALAVQRETLERLGHILLTHGFLTREELSKALQQQILQLIYRTFRWQDGDYHFAQEATVDYDQELVTPMPTESILMEGARMLDEWPIIEKKISDRTAVYVPTKAAEHVEVASEEDAEELIEFEFEQAPLPLPEAAPAATIRVTPVEHHVLQLLTGANTVDDVVRASMYGEFDTCKAFYTLLNRGLIRRASRSELAQAQQAVILEEPVTEGERVGVPWLLALLAPLLAASLFLSIKNPANILLGPAPSPLPHVVESASFVRMWGVVQVLHSVAHLTGSYPDSLAELTQQGFLSTSLLHDPWNQPYRYVLREHSLILAGDGPHRRPNPKLVIMQSLPSGPEALAGVKGVELLDR